MAALPLTASGMTLLAGFGVEARFSELQL